MPEQSYVNAVAPEVAAASAAEQPAQTEIAPLVELSLCRRAVARAREFLRPSDNDTVSRIEGIALPQSVAERAAQHKEIIVQQALSKGYFHSF